MGHLVVMPDHGAGRGRGREVVHLEGHGLAILHPRDNGRGGSIRPVDPYVWADPFISHFDAAHLVSPGAEGLDQCTDRSRSFIEGHTAVVVPEALGPGHPTALAPRRKGGGDVEGEPVPTGQWNLLLGGVGHEHASGGDVVVLIGFVHCVLRVNLDGDGVDSGRLRRPGHGDGHRPQRWDGSGASGNKRAGDHGTIVEVRSCVGGICLARVGHRGPDDNLGATDWLSGIEADTPYGQVGLGADGEFGSRLVVFLVRLGQPTVRVGHHTHRYGTGKA